MNLSRYAGLVFGFSTFVALVVHAQTRTVTLDSAKTQLNEVTLVRLPDAGVSMVVNAYVTESGVTLQDVSTCELGQLTAPQRTCLQTIRTGATSCWNNAHGF